jgi:protein-L-isoaspartate(D-aspartate) O-methyltransferase
VKNKNLLNERASLIERLIQVGVLQKKSHINAILSVEREFFVWDGFEKFAYLDKALPLGETGQTISPVSLCAHMIKALDPRIGENILEVGTGSGYNAALLAECVAPSTKKPDFWGRVITIERIYDLYEFALDNLNRSGYSNRVENILGDGTLGFPLLHEDELYDKIIVTAGAPSVPTPLLRQLKKGGVMVIPIGDRQSQHLMMVIKGFSGLVEEIPFQRCEFVPLIGCYGWS